MGKLEQDFAIGRPARSAAHKTCTRCKGTGWWQLARVCFRCGGTGNFERVTIETRIRDKKAHIAEVRGIIDDLEDRLATPRKVWGRSQLEEKLAADRTNLGKLEAELIALEVKAVTS